MKEIETTRESIFATAAAAAGRDPAFRARLLENANVALVELGIEPAPGVTVKVVEETPGVRYLVLPALPSPEIVGDDLDQIAAGGVGDLFRNVVEGVSAIVDGTSQVANGTTDVINGTKSNPKGRIRE